MLVPASIKECAGERKCKQARRSGGTAVVNVSHGGQRGETGGKRVSKGKFVVVGVEELKRLMIDAAGPKRRIRMNFGARTSFKHHLALASDDDRKSTRHCDAGQIVH